ncbi:MAG: AIR synthase-related protein [Spirochaetales bacterium]
MRIERSSKSLSLDSRGQRVCKITNHALGRVISSCAVIDVYLLEGIEEFSGELAKDIFLDPIAEKLWVGREAVQEILPDWDFRIEVAYKPGVTDPEALTAREAIELSLGYALSSKTVVQTARQYAFKVLEPKGINLSFLANQIALLLYNPLIEVASCLFPREQRRFSTIYPYSVPPSRVQVERISLESLTEQELETLSRNRLLSLTLSEMQAIQDYYRNPSVKALRNRLGIGEIATDVELEMIAQTWSEHCKHKIFAARIRYQEPGGKEETIDSLFKTYIKETTCVLQKNRPDLRSVFYDNSGVVDFDEENLICMKVETHNSPSALDPYGGAITGIVGVNRDILGTGLGARPIFNTNVLCFGEPDTPKEEVPPPLIHPRRVLLGVHKGIVDGGNQSGIPTVAGAFLFDESYRGKPLVFCGTGGILPRYVNGKPSWEKQIEAGDLAVMAGGRVGKDGIHGATFSSAALDETSPSSAVQIGDPITQKKLSDFLLEARDQGLYRALTDNGAGGLSSSLGEMAQMSGGVKIWLDRCPLKYPGLAPWEILVSESQERMSFAVPKEHIEQFLSLAKARGVEAAVVGEFTSSGRVEVYHEGVLVACLDLAFLHEGVPRLQLQALWEPPVHPATFSLPSLTPDSVKSLLLRLLADPNIASKESLVRQYDHEVQGGSIVKPFMGERFDAPMDGGIVRPRYDSYRGITITHGVKPRYSDYDTYAMAIAAVDEAYRSHIALGGDPELVSALDNFCWPDPVPAPDNPDGSYKLAQLVRACKGLQEACLSYQLPLISGKDSMKNDARIGEKKLSVRPTLLITLMGIIQDVRKAITTDFKHAGDRVYLLGKTPVGLGGSYLEAFLKERLGFLPPFNPKEVYPLYVRLHTTLQKGWVASCHDVSDGGVAAALCESALGGRLGVSIELEEQWVEIAPTNSDSRGVSYTQGILVTEEMVPPLRAFSLLFGECPGRFVVSVPQTYVESFEDYFREFPCYPIGWVTDNSTVQLQYKREGGEETVSVQLTLEEIETAWKSFSNEIIS